MKVQIANRLSLALCTASILAIAGGAQAQTSGATALEEIVVTAQKRSENLQNVPIAVSAITAGAAESRGVRGGEDIQQVTPSLSIGRAANVPLIFIRGVGTQNTSAGEEPSVSLYVDGVYVATAINSLFALNNIERVEVLRGPQGTLFGRNATGGLIHIITKDPTFAPSGRASIGYGNYDTLEGKFYGSTGITDNLAADFAAYYTKRSKGFGHNLFTGSEVGLNREYALRSKLLWTPSDDTRVTLSADYADQDTDVGLSRQVGPGVIAIDGFGHPGDYQDIRATLDPQGTMHRWSTSGKLEHDFGGLRLVSISAYQYNSAKSVLDLDGSTLPRTHTFNNQRSKAFTQEIQLQSQPDSPVQWVVGGFYLDARAVLDPLIITGTAAGPAGVLYRYGQLDTTSYSGFAQATAPLGEATKLTAGVRYTHDKKDFSGRQGLPGALGAPVVGSLSNSKVTYRLALDHKLSDTVLAYATLNRGFKSGSFNLNSITNPPVRPETLDAYEAGLKSELFDRRLRLNLSAYLYNYKDIQLTQTLGALSLVVNAAKARIKGVEAEFEAAVTDNFTLSGGVSLTDGKYRRFPNAPASFREPYTCALGGPGPGDPLVGNQQCSADASGHDTIRTPPVTLNLAATYTAPLAGGELGITVSGYHNGGFFYEADNRVKERAYELLNGEVRWTAPGDRYTVALWGRNLLDKDYYNQTSTSTQDQFSPGAPRAFGATVSYSF